MTCVIMNSSIFIIIFLHLFWLLLFTSHLGVCREIVCIESERETLLKLKHHLTDPSNRLSSWNSTSIPNCCLWHGVVCNNFTAHVAELHLNTTSPPSFDDYSSDEAFEIAYEAHLRTQFGGEINPCLVDLKHLNYFDVSGNELLGRGMPIPAFLTTMTSLTHLNLSLTGFIGNIPPQIGNLSNLVYLDLGYAANGSIPSQIRNLSNLVYLQLRGDSYYDESLFAENLDWLSSLSKLEYLDLSGNYLLGGGMPIPTLLATITSLSHLDLSYAGFMGNIPPQIGNLSNLVYLDLSYAANGTIPSQIRNLSNLLYLHLEGYYPESLFAENLDWLSSLSKLEYLYLGGSNLSKTFDWLHTLQALPSLKHLYLSDCTLPAHYNQPSTLNFSSLLTLDLSYISYSHSAAISSVPKWIFGLTKLVSLQFRGHFEIQGPIPDAIQNLTLLQNLDLSDNSLLSSVPDCLYSLHHLKFLNLGFNKLRGNISDALGNLTSLVQLDLSYNELEGTIPTSLGNLTSLVHLGLSYNELEGTIPTSLGNLTSLVHLGLSYNELEGTIPTSLGNLCNLRYIDFSGLKLNQQVDDILAILAPCISHGLTTLLVSDSQLSGNLTDRFGIFKNIFTLGFSHNLIGGAIPKSFGKLSSLRNLYLSENQFSGNPFESLRSLSKLSDLEIADNHFEGVVKEDHLVNLTSLEVLYASGNNLTLKLGPNWLPTFQLTRLDMSSWQLGPNFPSWIQSQSKLQVLEMSNAGLVDYIPTWFWEPFSQVYYLNLSHNHIHGELATTLKHPISISSVDLSSNDLHGKLPYLSNDVYKLDISGNSLSESMDDFLCKQHGKPMQVEFLNLASNNLSGEMPDCWMIWPFLVDVNLQSNHFIGNLPPSMGSLAELQFLHVSNNSFSGIFPTIFMKTNKLISLDLGENKFSGTIPTWVGERLLNVKILRLRTNGFVGHIPNKICDMSHLQVLDLAQNNLSGNIPSCFNNLSAMTLMNRSRDPLIYSEALNHTAYTSSYSIVSVLLWLKGRVDEYRNFLGLVTSIDLSNNKLSGEIPRKVTNLNALNFLNLSHNQLIGHIPQGIGDMGSLQSIDFSRNNLSGEIPATITNLSFLGMLDLSYNHLKGKIPTGTQLQSFDASNFIGNDLCGPPLPINCSSNWKIDSHDHNGKGSRHGVNWFFVNMAFGFVVGFWIVIAPLFISRSWRYAYFHFLDHLWFRLQSLL